MSKIQIQDTSTSDKLEVTHYWVAPTDDESNVDWMYAEYMDSLIDVAQMAIKQTRQTISMFGTYA